MKVVKSKRKENTVFLEVEESFEVLRSQMDKVYPKVAKNVQIPGFRKGKVPRAIFEKHYGEEPILQDAVVEVINSAYRQAIDELELAVIDLPKNVDVAKYKPNEPVSFTCEVDVKPEVKLGKYKGIKLKRESTAVSDDDVQASIDQFLSQHAQFASVDRASQEHDVIRFKLTASIDGESYGLWTRENAGTSIGKGPFGHDFDQAVTGLSKDEEKTFSVTYDDQFSNPDVHNKTVEFTVVITDIQEKQLPELTDELVAKLSEFKTVADYTADIRTTLENQKKQASETQLEQDLMTAITDAIKLDIPKAMVDRETDSRLTYFEHTLKQQGSNLETFATLSGKTLDAFRSEIDPESEKHVKTKLVLEAIGKKEAVHASDDDLNAEIAKWNIPDVKTVADVESKHLHIDLEQVKQTIIEKKTVEFLLSESKIVD